MQLCMYVWINVCMCKCLCMRACGCMYVYTTICIFILSTYHPIQIDFYNVLTHVQRGLLTLMLQNVVHAFHGICILHVYNYFYVDVLSCVNGYRRENAPGGGSRDDFLQHLLGLLRRSKPFAFSCSMTSRGMNNSILKTFLSGPRLGGWHTETKNSLTLRTLQSETRRCPPLATQREQVFILSELESDMSSPRCFWNIRHSGCVIVRGKVH